MPPKMHIRFGEDVDEEELAEAQFSESSVPKFTPSTSAAQPLAAPSSSAPCARLSVLTSVRTDFGSKSDCYVFDVAQSQAGEGGVTLAASLSNNRIKLYAARDSELAPVGDLAGHGRPITQISFALPESPAVLHSSSRDGTVRGWDTRTKQEGERIDAKRKELFSFSIREHVLAVGADSEVMFWDRRTGKQLGTFQDAHAEEVTQVKFHPNHPNVFLSSSSDGLISVYNLSGGLNEDDAFDACLNTGNSNAEVGFFGTASERLWCRTHTEGLHLWNWAAACSEEGLDGGGAQLAMEDFREVAGQAAAAAGVAELAHKVDYIVDCTYKAGSNALWVKAGNNEGHAAIFPVLQDPNGAFAIGAPSACLSGGHNSVVRCLLWPGVGTRCLTAGEDSRMCIWDLPGSTAVGGQHHAAVERRHNRADRGFSPY